ncbi:hypothetical protein [Streptomyces sp. TE5632]
MASAFVQPSAYSVTVSVASSWTMVSRVPGPLLPAGVVTCERTAMGRMASAS